jgi:hypothetical protein
VDLNPLSHARNKVQVAAENVDPGIVETENSELRTWRWGTENRELGTEN